MNNGREAACERIDGIEGDRFDPVEEACLRRSNTSTTNHRTQIEKTTHVHPVGLNPMARV